MRDEHGAGARPLPGAIETARLLLRPLEEADLPFFVELHGRRDVVRFLGGDGTPRTPEVTRAWLERMRRWYERDHLGPYAIVRRSDGALLGRSGLSVFELRRAPGDERPTASWGLGSAGPVEPPATLERVLEVGYVVHPDAWGGGYATEAAGAWYTWALEERGAEVLWSMIHPENHGSRRVAEKNGLVRHADALLDERVYDLYRLTRAAARRA